MDFYVYLHRKATTGEIFYVGKGTGDRAWKSGAANRGSYWCRVARKHGLIVEIVADRLQEWYAHELERDLIALHGRKDLGYGPLVNLTDGGDGLSGFIFDDQAKAKMSASAQAYRSNQSTRARYSAAARKARSNPEINAKYLALAADQQVRDRMKAGRLAAWSDPEIRERQTAAIRAALSRPIACVEAGITFESIASAARWLRETCSPKASIGTLGLAVRGERNTAYGYTWRYA